MSCAQPGVASELEPDELDIRAVAALVAKRTPLLIDVRGVEEFTVSHIVGALQVAPDTSPDALVKLLAKRLKGTTVILYCTVGTRSMGLGINVQEDLLKAGAKSVYVMKDGLVAWANADLPLVDHMGPTRFVHPSDQATRARFSDPGRARFEPRR